MVSSIALAFLISLSKTPLFFGPSSKERPKAKEKKQMKGKKKQFPGIFLLSFVLSSSQFSSGCVVLMAAQGVIPANNETEIFSFKGITTNGAEEDGCSKVHRLHQSLAGNNLEVEGDDKTVEVAGKYDVPSGSMACRLKNNVELEVGGSWSHASEVEETKDLVGNSNEENTCVVESSLPEASLRQKHWSNLINHLGKETPIVEHNHDAQKAELFASSNDQVYLGEILLHVLVVSSVLVQAKNAIVSQEQETVDSIVTDKLQWPHRIVVPIGGIAVDTRYRISLEQPIMLIINKDAPQNGIKAQSVPQGPKLHTDSFDKNREMLNVACDQILSRDKDRYIFYLKGMVPLD
ncbi:hypothetical protein LOK49_LG12G01757 [Camellia lanceoleosa]|uniref:Uncharacterized protein n=1 Tax=Camellia lanceoleosa TaxID=1840588 RepID=A0ACC0FW65_9ERIC|nr:hypothetical protein LOK49_LG12G01757 [Camellia lanceoleosa]